MSLHASKVCCRNQEGWQTRRVAEHSGVHDCGAQCGKWAACVQRTYWKQHLAGAPALLELPTDFLRPPQPSGRGRVVSFEVPAEVVGGVRALAASCSATLFMALMAAWQVNTLQQYSMTADSPPDMTLLLIASTTKFASILPVPELPCYLQP